LWQARQKERVGTRRATVVGVWQASQAMWAWTGRWWAAVMAAVRWQVAQSLVWE
jgi:hypothetical protein